LGSNAGRSGLPLVRSHQLQRDADADGRLRATSPALLEARLDAEGWAAPRYSS